MEILFSSNPWVSTLMYSIVLFFPFSIILYMCLYGLCSFFFYASIVLRCHGGLYLTRIWGIWMVSILSLFMAWPCTIWYLSSPETAPPPESPTPKLLSLTTRSSLSSLDLLTHDPTSCLFGSNTHLPFPLQLRSYWSLLLCKVFSFSTSGLLQKCLLL